MPSRRLTVSATANYFLLFLSWAVFTPYLQLYLKARGHSPSRIGLLLGCMELAGVAGPIVIGRLADSRGTFRILLAVGFLVPVAVFVPLELTSLFPISIACLIVVGFSYRSTIPLLDSIVSRLLPDPARQYGRLRVAGSVGFVAISLFLQLTGLVSTYSSLSILVAFGATALLGAFAVPLLPAVPFAPPALPARHDAPRDKSRSGLDARFWAVIAIIFLGRFGIGAYYSFFSLYLKEAFPGMGVSMLWAIGPLAEIPTIWFSGPLIRRWGIRVMLTVSLAAVSIRLGLFVLAPSIAVIALAQLLHAFTFGTFHTAAVAYVSSTVGEGRRGVGMAIYNSVACGLGSFLASAVGGFVLEAHGFAALFLGYAAVPLAGIALLAAFGKKLLPARTPRPARPRA